jgi:uncharacterized protein YktB (UPF0637 family)
LITLVIVSCQRVDKSIHVLTCRKKQSYVDVLGVYNKTALIYINDTAHILIQNLQNPETYSMCMVCEDTLTHFAKRLYKVMQKSNELQQCSYDHIIKSCLENPKDTTYTWTTKVYTVIEIPNIVSDKTSCIDLMVTDSIYKYVLYSNSFLLITLNDTAYCDCATHGRLVMNPPNSKQVTKITVKHYHIPKHNMQHIGESLIKF